MSSDTSHDFVSGSDRSLHDVSGQQVKGTNRFSPQTVAALHSSDDLDVAKDSHHHTLGPGINQAANGGHNHDGVTSPQLLAGVTLTGAKGGNAALASVCAALTLLGATDNTTA